MNDDSSFEKQFEQNVKEKVQVQQQEKKNTIAQTGSNGIAGAKSQKNLLAITIAILAFVILVESIALAITLNNYFSLVNDEDTDNVVEGDIDLSDDNHVYDDEDNLKSIQSICTAESGMSYSLDNSNKYKQSDSSGTVIDSGDYKIVNYDLVSLSNNDKVLYYDGTSLADGLIIYTCE